METKEKVVNVSGTVDAKVIAIIVLTFTLLMMIFGYNLGKSDTQEAIEGWKESKSNIARHERDINTLSGKIADERKKMVDYAKTAKKDGIILVK